MQERKFLPRSRLWKVGTECQVCISLGDACWTLAVAQDASAHAVSTRATFGTFCAPAPSEFATGALTSD